jgi:hypothetical protein
VADDKEATEQTLRSIELELRTCWSELGLVDEDEDNLDDLAIPKIKRKIIHQLFNERQSTCDSKDVDGG